jgi:hypothetical protein
MAVLGNTQHRLLTCPACGQDVFATLSLDAELGDVDLAAKTVSSDLKITGLRVTHDCTPRGTR